ncbi:MAG: VanZ family protein [Aquisalinus sp.]|nr:VanZ family protein [Aquisalinus sp.]
MMNTFDFLLQGWWIRLMRIVYAFLLIVIVVLSLVPTEESVPGSNLIFGFLAELLLGSADHADKMSHMLAYAAITGVGMLGIIRPLGRFLLLPVSMLLLSALLELGQGAIAGRTPDMMDLLANLVGVATGAAVAGFLLMLARQQAQRKQPAL